MGLDDDYRTVVEVKTSVEPASASESVEYDIYRHSPLRYMGYCNEVDAVYGTHCLSSDYNF